MSYSDLVIALFQKFKFHIECVIESSLKVSKYFSKLTKT